jgi:Tol biopolymer transport system component
MGLERGERLSIYEVTGTLGAGAMGTVYGAKDTTLDRDVAIKMLSDDLAQDEEHLARFEREAKLLATLSHGNIASIFAVEQQEERRFLVMELVPGVTLGERIAAGPLRTRDVLRLARQIADGLEAAHEAGVVHRDLKPDNIRITPDDTVKLLDFGLAKEIPAPGSESGRSPEDSLNLTQTGVILGTPYYMSPEQVRGRLVDRRADIWAFGCVLYEALTGERAFPGDTLAEVAAMVLEHDPDLDALPADTPPRVRELLAACLTRDPKNRLRDMGDARRELDAALNEKPVVEGAATHESRTYPGSARVAIGALGVAVFALAVALVMRPSPSAAPVASERPELRFQVPLPVGTELKSIALAPDGAAMALGLHDPAKNENSVVLRRFDVVGLEPLERAGRASLPFFSPDGTELGYVAEDGIRILTLASGQVRTVCECSNPRGTPAWGRDGTIVFAPTYDSPLMRVSSAGGEPEPATELDVARFENSHRHASWIAGTDRFVFRAHFAAAAVGTLPDPPHLYVKGPDGTRTPLVPGNYRAGYLAGHLVWLNGPRIFGRAFDPVTGTFSRQAFEIARDVEYQRFAASPAGVLAFQGGASKAGDRTLVWHGLDGAVHGVIPGTANFTDPDPHPIDERIVVNIHDKERFSSDLWILDGRGGRSALTRGEGAITPIWSPDGNWVAYASFAADREPIVCVRRADGTGERREVGDGTSALDWSRDGKWLASTVRPKGKLVDGFRFFRMEKGKDESPLELREVESSHPRFSPDGRWLAYHAGEESVVYVRSFPDLKNRRAVSGGFGTHPVWMPDGKSIVFVGKDGAAMQVELTEQGGALVAKDKPKRLFGSRIVLWNTAYRVAPDGQRILVNTEKEPNLAPVTVITGWRPPKAD